MEMVINVSLVRVIKQVIDEDGSVKDSAVCLFLHLLIWFTFTFSSCFIYDFNFGFPFCLRALL
jgi:hypothetical protein